MSLIWARQKPVHLLSRVFPNHGQSTTVLKCWRFGAGVWFRQLTFTGNVRCDIAVNFRWFYINYRHPKCSLHGHIFLYHPSLCLKIYLSLSLSVYLLRLILVPDEQLLCFISSYEEKTKNLFCKYV